MQAQKITTTETNRMTELISQFIETFDIKMTELENRIAQIENRKTTQVK